MSQKQEKTSSSDAFSLPETALDGVRYAQLQASNKVWRLGSLSPHWKEELPVIDAKPDQEALQKLAAKNIFLNTGERPKLAVMCCGLGSAWPGMGRELYDNFPAARAAMDSLAAYSDWDILSVMDESDTERLNHSRIQIPYLFMLEYAQWSQLTALGLKPDLICGHSLGELVALCLAGVYDLHAAWHLFEIRSAHMARLEENSANESGMLAISAGYDIVQKALLEYPDLHISNCNTPRQYILGGPRPQLLELRKNLRRQRIPAFMLSINLAFHNPYMRILRDLSLRRLNGLEMHAPAIPMLSCITAGPYPRNQAEICRYIADLDENTVEWTKSVNALRHEYNIQHFLELGPQETLCGLVNEIYPAARCFSASRKGHESQAMRELCARLYSLGLLREKNISKLAALKNHLQPDIVKMASKTVPSLEPQEKSPEWDTVMELIAEESGRPVQDLRPELDLRYDLALRSSRFPYLVQEAERRLNRQIALENLLQISTVGDLANFLTGAAASNKKAESSPAELPVNRPSRFIIPPIAAFTLSSASKDGLEAWHPNPDAPQLLYRLSGPIALCVMDEELLPQIWSGMAPFGLKLLIPSFLLKKCADLEKGGNELLPLAIDPDSNADALIKSLKDAEKTYGSIKGILYIPPPLTDQVVSSFSDSAQKFFSFLPHIMDEHKKAWLCCLVRHISAPMPQAKKEKILTLAADFFKRLNFLFPHASFPFHAIFWQDSRSLPNLQNQNEAGDMLARELLYTSPREIIWLDAALDSTLNQSPVYCPSAPCMDIIQSDSSSAQEARLGIFRGECQFSAFADPQLSSHGELPIPAEMSPGNDKAPWLPLGYILKSLLSASRLACPWLSPFEISDVLVDCFPLLPYGLVRECKVQAQSRQWLPREKKLARLCQTSLSVRELSINGRRTDRWAPVCEALCILGSSSAEMAAYHNAPLPDLSYSPISPSLLDAFYEALHFGEEWRILHDFAIQQSSPEKGVPFYYQARITERPEYIAGSSEWEYDAFAFLIEAIYEALSLALLMPNDDVGTPADFSSRLKKWHFRRIGFLRFVDSLEQYRGELLLSFNRAWEDSHFTRFDGRIETISGKTILSFLHCEFKQTE